MRRYWPIASLVIEFRRLVFGCRWRDAMFRSRVSARQPRYFLLRKPSMAFALRASLWLFKFAPGEFVRRQKKVSKEKATRNSANFLRFTKTIHGFRPAGQPIGCSNLLQANLSLLARVFGRGFPGPPKTSGIPAAPLRADLAKSCDARGGITGTTPSR